MMCFLIVIRVKDIWYPTCLYPHHSTVAEGCPTSSLFNCQANAIWMIYVCHHPPPRHVCNIGLRLSAKPLMPRMIPATTPCCQCCVNENPDLSQSLTHYDTSRCCQLIPRTLQRTAIRFGFRGIFSVKLRTQNFLYFWQLESGTKVNFLFLQPGDLVPWFVTARTSHCTKVSITRLTLGVLEKSKSF